MGVERRIVYAVASREGSHVDATLSNLRSLLNDCEVTVVESTSECRREVENGDVAAVLTDYELPDGTGVELAASLDRDGCDVPVVLFSGSVTPERVSESRQEAVSEFVQRKTDASTRVAAETVRSTVEETERTEPSEVFRQHLQVAVDAIEDGIYALDDDDRFVAVNDAYTEMTGYSRAELVGEPASKVVGEDLTREIADMRSSLADGASVVTVESQMTAADGRSFPIEARVAPYPLGDDRYGRVGVVRDISERKQLERELSETLERITDAFFAVDTDWRFTYVNERAEELLQRPESELLGEVLWDEFPAAVETTFQQMYERAMESQEPVSFEEYYGPLERWFEVNAYPSESGLSVYFQDVTARVEAEERRRERERQFEAIFNDPLSFFALLDSDGTVRQVNEAALDFVGAEHDDVVGEYFWDCPWWNHSEALQSTLRRKLGRVAEGEYVRFEAENRSPSGDRITVDFQGRPVERDGEVTGIVAEGIDITAQKEFQRELRHQRDLNQQVIDTAPVGIVVVDGEGRVEYSNARMEELAGVSLDRIEDDDVEFTFVERDGQPLSQDDLSYSRVLESDELPFTHVLETGEEVYDVEIGVVRPDGEVVWASVNGSLIRENGDGDAHGIFTLEDVTEAKRRAERFEALNQRMQRLPEAETADDVCRTIIDAAADVLNLPCSYIALYDEGEGTLETAAATDVAADRVDTPLLGDVRDSPVWDAFVRDEVIVDDFEDDAGPQSVAAIPLGDHGVFVTITTEDDAFSETDLVLVDMLGATAQSSLDRAARETVLRHQRNTLEEKNDRLERVNRINRAIRNITQVLIRADTHEQIESLVCERLASIEPYTFAWVGHLDHATDEVTPVVSAGGEKGDLETLVDGDADDAPPYSRVVETKQPQVHNDILRDAPSSAWRKEVLARGFRASITVPLQYRNTLYGVLSLYSERPEVFAEMETTVLEELGETIGYAMNAVERKKALVSESSVELKFDVPTLEAPFLGFVDGTKGSFRLENVVRRLDGHIHVFFNITGVDRETLYEDVEQSPDVDHLKVISESEEDGETTYFCECTLHRETFVSNLVDRGALLDTITVEDEAATITIRIPQSADVRDFVEFIEDSFGGVNLLARRELDEPVMTSQEFKSEVRNRLTERQEEVIKTAYFSGFFEWPRKSNGQDVAEILDVTQPTVNRHIRAGERTMFGVLFDEKAD